MRRLLFISHRLPYPPDKGERVRAFQEIKALAERFDVTLACPLCRPSDLPRAAGLRRWVKRVILAPSRQTGRAVRAALSLLRGRSASEGYFSNPSLETMIARETSHRPFEVAMCYCSAVLPYGLKIQAKARIIDLVDADSAKWADYASTSAWPMRTLFRKEARAVGRLEQQALSRFDAVIVTSQIESRALGQAARRAVVIANGVDASFFSPQCVEPSALRPKSLVFVGTMNYWPNVKGVRWFVRNVWLEVKRRIPELTFTIVGRNPTAAVRRLARVDGIHVTGSVPDVRIYLAAADVVVCPLQIARGIQNKVLEAMAMGKAVLASTAAIEGLKVTVGRHLLRADHPREYSRLIGDLLADEPYRTRLGRSARQLVESRYTWPGRMGRLVSLCEELCGDPRPSAPATVASPAAQPTPAGKLLGHPIGAVKEPLP